MHRAGLLILAIASVSTGAADFDVQIGAFRNPGAAVIDVPASVGEVRTTLSDDGLTRFLVGPFASRAEAERARDDLRARGHTGAFVRQAGRSPGTSPAPARRVAGAGRAPGAVPSRRDLERLAGLSEAQRQNVVYLDGVLHRKVGDEFIPLRD